MEKNISFPAVRPFQFTIRYEKRTPRIPADIQDLHIHAECQIYINLSGDVEFLVEDQLYPIQPGSVIIVRPNEFHHCIFRSPTAVHEHFCLYLTPEGNETLLSRFFHRQAGRDNLIVLATEDLAAAKSLCFSLLSGAESPILQYRALFGLLALIERGTVPERPDATTFVPPDVQTALAYIYENLSDPFTISDMATAAHVSRNTLERHFLATLHITPSEFLKQRRLNHARQQLLQGMSVQEAGQRSGFSDCSHFIALFRKRYGVTPLQFRKAESPAPPLPTDHR